MSMLIYTLNVKYQRRCFYLCPQIIIRCHLGLGEITEVNFNDKTVVNYIFNHRNKNKSMKAELHSQNATAPQHNGTARAIGPSPPALWM